MEIPKDQTRDADIELTTTKSTDMVDFYGHLLASDDATKMKEKERRAKLKVDLLILPLLSSVYFLAQIGRSDLANAKIAGMDEDLGLTPKMYSNVASVFYAGYLFLQLPGTLLLKKTGPPLQFGCAMIAWGVVTVCTVEVNTYTSLMVVRTFVGAAEAFLQGCLLYLTFFYNNTELALRGAIFYSTSALAGAFNGLVSYAIETNLDGVNGWPAWKWIFLIEGIVPIGWAFVVFFCLPASPETLGFGFTKDEKEILIKRSRAAYNTAESKVRPKLLLKLLADPKFWPLVLMECGIHYCASSIGNFLPDILRTFGWSSVKAQLMTVVVYACAFVSIIFCCRMADKLRQRGLMIVICCSLGAIGYCMLLAATNDTVRFAATCIVAMGVFPNTVICMAWMASIMIGYTYRAGAAAIINVIATCVAISGNQAYSDPPTYRIGHGSAMGMIVLTGLTAAALSVWLRILNKQKRLRQYTDEAEGLRECSIDDIGNKHPDFFYGY